MTQIRTEEEDTAPSSRKKNKEEKKNEGKAARVASFSTIWREGTEGTLFS